MISLNCNARHGYGAPLTAAVLWAGRLLDGLATFSPLLACVMLWGQFYLSGGGLKDLALPRQWLGLIFPGID
jgi:hypothetical protein